MRLGRPLRGAAYANLAKASDKEASDDRTRARN